MYHQNKLQVRNELLNMLKLSEEQPRASRDLPRIERNSLGCLIKLSPIIRIHFDGMNIRALEKYLQHIFFAYSKSSNM